jgi:FMN reductase
MPRGQRMRNTAHVSEGAGRLTIVGLGGSLRAASHSRAALEVALAGAEEAGAETKLLDLRELALPMFDPEHESPAGPAAELVETCYAADGMLWSSPLYQGTVSGAFKNSLDWLHILGSRDPPYLHDKVVGLISAAGGMQGLQAINTMEFSARALRAWAVPYVVPIASAARAFDRDGRVHDDGIEAQLRTLGGEVVRVTTRFVADATLDRIAECERVADRVALAGAPRATAT